jgi:23S rRNA (guanosine2251-2'-O)-methyltransferase
LKKLKLQELQRLSADAFRTAEKTPLALVLDNIRSGLNVGSAFRTADAFALQHVYLCGITAQPPHREILKTAIGATASMEWSYFDQTTDAIQQLKKDGWSVWVVEQTTSSTALQDFQWESREKIALVFGNEVKGVSNEILPMVEGSIEVPQFGTKHSLNISVCVGVVVWELFRKWKYDVLGRQVDR